jgi:Holliday junction resolvase RusA-like endonuclease
VPLLDVRVHGLPIAQGRPRAFKTPQGHVRVYDPATSRDWKRTVVAQVLERKPATPAEGPLAMELVFYFPRPKSLPKRIRHHTTRPDADNCAKAIKDALRGVIYRDDAQVVRLTISKAYDPSPGVAIRVEPVVEQSAL